MEDVGGAVGVESHPLAFSLVPILDSSMYPVLQLSWDKLPELYICFLAGKMAHIIIISFLTNNS